MAFLSVSLYDFKMKEEPSGLWHRWMVLQLFCLMISVEVYLPLIILLCYSDINIMDQKALAKIFLLVGFFGSGKTTFIRHLLSAETGEKYAIIQNEFAEGQMGIQQPLIMDETGTPFSSFLQLPNGCICCSAKNDLMAAIQYIVENTQVKNIVVETNGIADPAQSIKQFWFDEEMNIKAELHSVISLISAKKWGQISKDPTLQKQVVFANKILITFADTVAEQPYQQMLQQLRSMNQDCIFDRSDSYKIQTFIKGNTIFDQNTLLHLKDVKPKHHHHQIQSVFLAGYCLMSSKLQFQKVVGRMLWESQLKILRMKGAVCLGDSQHVYELQGVDDCFQLKQSKSSTALYQKITKILIIGQDLNTQQLRKQLQLTSQE